MNKKQNKYIYDGLVKTYTKFLLFFLTFGTKFYRKKNWILGSKQTVNSAIFEIPFFSLVKLTDH